MASSSAAARASTSAFGRHVESYLALSGKPKPLRLVYQTTPTWPFVKQNSGQVDVGVLDSSFNPPTKAHYALASSSKPQLQDDGPKKHYDALLLLFSVKNADKGMGTSKDASASQRLGMMQCLAHDLERDLGANVAVGIVEEPLMIDKSTLIHQYVAKERQEEARAPMRLHWLVGFDTLERFFQVKYYPSPEFFAKACKTYFEQERTTFICARRGVESQPNKQSSNDQQTAQGNAEEELLRSDEVRPWVEKGSVVMMDLDASAGVNSSTAIRKLLQESSKSSSELSDKLGSMTTESVSRFIADENLYSRQ